eukprot:CAMPEP_0181494606 /NCGR_PEP_ID=MMETSP1110-20121109/51865_1 /TAXON_ID=174948 /ORGANISM="Symbiodinium sp., Strain CCMP421" /LENGTH=56 /DNA_ID=CAMNT_0023622037 /DNA_START=439 /DNA_END=605 /DNA_ORIENTATION=+
MDFPIVTETRCCVARLDEAIETFSARGPAPDEELRTTSSVAFAMMAPMQLSAWASS